MPRIIPYIVKSRTPKQFTPPLRYQELERCFLGYADRDMYLQVHSTTWRAFPDTPRKEILPSGDHHLLTLRFDPEGPPHSWKGDPWYELPEATVVQARAYALPRAEAHAAGLRHELLCEAVAGALKRLARPNLWENRWSLRFILRGQERQIETWLERWTGLRREDEERWQTPLFAEAA